MKYPTKTIGEICKYTTSGGTPKTSIRSYYEPPIIPWLTTKEVNYNRIYKTNSAISSEGLERSSAKLIPENSVIVAMYGQGDTAGRVAINKIPLTTNQACCNIVVDENKADYRFGCIVGNEYWVSTDAGILKKPFPYIEEIPIRKHNFWSPLL